MLNTSITSSNFYSDEASQRLVQYLEENQKSLLLEDSILYYEFPLFKELDQPVNYASLLLISPSHGIVIFQCDSRSFRELDESKIQSLNEYVSQIFVFVYSKLIKNKNLRQSRNSLLYDISTVLYLPNYNRDVSIEIEDTHILLDNHSLTSFFSSNQREEEITAEIISETCAILEGSKGIIKPKDRNLDESLRGTKGVILADLEKEIARFDEKQKSAAISQIDGPQRIRGLAGSGKTVVLAMKAALIHVRNPNATVLYTFYTKSLYDHIKLLITRFYRTYVEKDPDWDKIHVRHAWGGSQTPGVYYEACKRNNVSTVNFREAATKSKTSAFDYVCKDILRKTNIQIIKAYDYVLMDEAQDFPPSFYWLCRKLVKNDNLVWAYDELQNILNVEMQRTTLLFRNEFGDDGIDLDELQKRYPKLDNDIVLSKCYRNPKEVLVVAHALGFGIYGNKMVQMLENVEHWQDVGYIVEQGECKEGEETAILRPEYNSPLSISSSQDKDELIKTFAASDFNEEVDWICNSIIEDLQQYLLPEDIMVISVDDRNARRYFDAISEKLLRNSITSNNVLNSFDNDFAIEGSVTLSTVYRAKGNEAAVVYVIGVDALSSKLDYIVERNKLFTAFTRAKGWLRVSGIGDYADVIENEIDDAKSKLPYLRFIYPNVEELKLHQRDLSKEHAKRAALREKVMQLFDQAQKSGLSQDDLIEYIQSEKHEK